ncbi:MAG TPA: FAD-dependent oxidoreductase [Candidatus Saccharimonadales bacterium]|nr:FAD-dependent oxidoreductase [Candidatus Saccharimonadales bacterium]
MARPPTDAAADTIVIGGGIVGVSVAAHLAERGQRVRLFERTALAAAASGRNSGVVQHPFDPVLVALYLETVECYRALEARTGGAFALPAEPVGLLSVGHDPTAIEAMTVSLAASHPRLQPTFLGPGQATALEPSVAPDVAACRLDIGYPVAPAAATLATAGRAADLGVSITIGADVRPWFDGGRVAGVESTDGQRHAAKDVVVAAGPWTPALVDPGGTWRPIRPLWGVVVPVTLAGPPRHVLEEADIDIEPGDDSVVETTGPSFSLVTAAGSSSLGSTFLDDEPDGPGWVPALVERGARFVPGVAGAPLGAVRVCARPRSRDGRPLIGRVPGIDGLWVAAGHGPWGISTGPASARLLADLLTGVDLAPPASLDPARFGAVLA